MNVRSAIAVAILVGSLGVQASAAERPATNAAHLQMVFTQTADECKATQIAWAHAHSPGARQGGMVTECFENATPPSDRRPLPPYFLQVVSASAPPSQRPPPHMSLLYRSLGPIQLAKDQAGADPNPPGSGTVRFYQMMVFSNPAPGQDAAYNDWYDHEHVPDVMRNAGFISGQRFVRTGAEPGKEMDLPRYLVVFTLKSADLKATGEEIGARIRDGRTRMSPAFNTAGVTAMFATPLGDPPQAAAQTPANRPPMGPKVADAKPGDMRLMVSGALMAPFKPIASQLQRAAGHPLVIEYGAARGDLRQEILDGQDFEVAILLPDVNQELLAKDKTIPGSFEIARLPAGIGLRGAVDGVDVSTPAALKSAMLNAAAVRYQINGAGQPTFDRIVAQLGIAAQVKDANKLKIPRDFPLAPGQYELDVFPISEILSNKSLRSLGPVIAEFQVPVVMEAVIGRHARDPQAAKAVIDFLRGPAVDEALKANGMEKPH